MTYKKEAVVVATASVCRKSQPKGWFFDFGYGIIKMVIKMLKKEKIERDQIEFVSIRKTAYG